LIGMLNNSDMIFHNRSQAVEELAQELMRLKLRDPFVLAIPRGGVPVGSVVAKALGCAFHVIPLIKVPISRNPEASYGAIATDGTIALNMPLIHPIRALGARDRDGRMEGHAGGREARSIVP
jgi:predicted phosphoribosyltransferase